MRALRVCPECGFHDAVPAAERLEQLLDPGSARRFGSGVATEDVLRFTDLRPYPSRLAAARAATGLDEAVVVARGRIEGHPVVVAVMDFRFLGGSLGAAVGELVTLAAEAALADRVPLLLVTASGGARMQEGAVSLMQMAKTSAALAALDEAGVATLSLITDPTYGGVAASFASLGDLLLAEPGARMGFAGPRVIRQTVREELPPGFQTAEFLMEHGLLDLIVPRAQLRERLGRLLGALSRAAVAGPSLAPGIDDPPQAIRDPALLPEPDPAAQVRAARSLDRPTSLDYFGLVFDDFVELHGDRIGADCPAVVGGLARLAGTPVVVIGHQKGHDAAELARRNFGMPTPPGYRKAARLMGLAAKLTLPVVTLVDTPGAYPGARAEEQGQSLAIAGNLRLMAMLPVPVVAVVTGEGGSGGALALAVADRLLMLSGSTFSVISPEGCAAILWHDRAEASRAAAALKLTPRDLLALGIVDAVIPEPEGGAGCDWVATALVVRQAVVTNLCELSDVEPERLVAERRARLRGPGPGGKGP
ncbi:hypothetical protein GCM10020218_067560 [Dactylosporangium vinaceum]